MSKYKKFIELEADAPIWSRRLAEMLNERGLTQAELADKTNGQVSASTITAWIAGDKNGKRTEPRTLGLLYVANSLQVSVDYLLGNTDIQSLDERSITIHRQTGLSEEAIQNLRHIGELSRQQRNQAPDSLSSLEILNELLSSSSFSNFFQGLYEYINYKVDDTKEFQLSEDGSLFLAHKKNGLASSIEARVVYPTSLLEDLYLKNITQELSLVKERHTIRNSAKVSKTTNRKKGAKSKLVPIKERDPE